MYFLGRPSLLLTIRIAVQPVNATTNVKTNLVVSENGSLMSQNHRPAIVIETSRYSQVTILAQSAVSGLGECLAS